PLSPGTLCRTKPTDLVFIIDSSRSVRPHEFEKIKVFVSRVIEALDVGPNATRVGVINYASAVRSELALQGPQSKAALLQAVRRIQPLSTGTMTGLAIQFAISRAFSAAEGARGSAPNFKKVKRGWFLQLLAWDPSWSGWEKQKGVFFWVLVPQTLPQHCPGSMSCVPLQSRFNYGANVGLCRAGCGWGASGWPLLKPPPPVLAVVSDLCATGDHDCEQVCVSTPGTYRCACRDGFSLNSDGKTCTACNGGLGSALDLVFLIDGSKSVRPENFELVKKFINQIVDSLEVSDKQAQVGLVQYSSRVRTEFPLNKYHSADEIKKAVMDVEYMEKGTMTGQALKYLVDSSFSVINGARPGVPKVGIVFTDGRSQDYISDAAKKAKDSGFRMFAVGVGNAVEDELREIASEPVAEHYFYTADFRTISKIGKKLQMKICVEEDPCECKSIVKFQTKVEELINSLQQ
ncbi:MATN1 protein, partial [Calcarius ornatus]|nr:MATN1 protein [Calcarius ornatus]